MASSGHFESPPGTSEPRRFVPTFHWELLVCGLRGHRLLGTDARRLRPEDAIFVREEDGLRWHRCLRCDSWVPLPPPSEPSRELPPDREEVDVPLRGRALRDRIVLRIIAVDRAVHFVVLSAVVVAIILFTVNRDQLRDPVFRVLADIQNGLGGSSEGGDKGIIGDLRRLFSVQSGTLEKVAVVIGIYALVEGAEAFGLWWQRRWAEYLTFVATTALLPLEAYELTRRLSPLKIITIIINLAVVVYLLVAKRLFGLRGGAAAEERERKRDAGWPAIERTAPGAVPAVARESPP
jgi:uncharacterized membrane protein (DUF2068 family)